jgi:hypothetical protein
MVGQPNLHDVLSRPEFEQLRQRVTVRYHLRPLDPDETAAYINHRLHKAALGAPLVFSKDVTALIAEASSGLPRKINVIADAVLLFGYGDDKHVIDASLVREVIEELTATGVLARPLPVAAAGATAAADTASVDAAHAAAEATERARQLAAREAAVALRERDLAEQRRVLTEQARLLKQHMTHATPSPAQTPSWPAPKASNVAQAPRPVGTPRVSRPMFTTQSRVPRRGLFARLGRTLFGTAKPVFED